VSAERLFDPGAAQRPEAIALAITVAVLYPILGWLRYRRLRGLPDPLPTMFKLRLYASIFVTQWILVIATGWVLHRAGGGFADIGQTLGVSLTGTLGMTALLIAGFAVLSNITLKQLRTAAPADFPEHLKRAGKILPWNNSERGAFAAVAFTAGICEEILYRGYLPWFIAARTGNVILGFALAAVVFGLGHAYQGRNGMIATGILGFFLGTVALAARSLLPGQVLHIAIDLVNGYAVGAAMERGRVEAAATLAPPADAADSAGSPGDIDASPAPPA